MVYALSGRSSFPTSGKPASAHGQGRGRRWATRKNRANLTEATALLAQEFEHSIEIKR